MFSKLQFQNKQQKGNVSEWINTLSCMIILTDIHVHTNSTLSCYECTCVHVLLSDYDSMIILLWMYCWVTMIVWLSCYECIIEWLWQYDYPVMNLLLSDYDIMIDYDSMIILYECIIEWLW